MRGELFGMKVGGPWAVVRGIYNLARTIWDPTRSDVQHGINTLVADALRDATPGRVAAFERERPEIAALFAERYDPDVDPRRLESLPDGTLGREYARFLRENRIDPLATLLAMGEPRNALAYSFRRAYKLHDLMHVTLGCDASILGEVRIVSYSLGQGARHPGRDGRAPALALAVLIMHVALRRPAEFRDAIRLAHEWMTLGERSRPHVPFRLEDHLAEPVERVRELVLAPA
jgi:ubiquinone biosynthesis protein Coq4